jgi:hypothetical protein
MKRALLIVLICLLPGIASATHIVGGEFEMIHRGVQLNGTHRFKLSLILYFDAINGAPGAKDSSALVRIFRKRDNVLMDEFLLIKILETSVLYKRPDGTNEAHIKTTRFYYTHQINGQNRDIFLDPDRYDDPEGYYIAWERCCRNYAITNVYSNDPADGIYAGQTFYLEFPPLRVNGADFVNSSPSLFPPLSDYACPQRLYTVDFRGTDPDGDSLVYSLTVPLNTKSGDALPPNGVRPGPYPTVTYRPRFSATNIMNGAPDLSISKNGFLSVVPTRSGLYVFAVRCEEYRNGVKIGEVRRDFQMKVLDNCPTSSPPVVEGKPKTATNFQRNNLTVAFPYGSTDEERCIDIRVSDPDAAIQNEKVEIIAVAVGFEDEDVGEILPEIPTATLKNGNPAMFSVCFPECPYVEGGYVIDIVVLNDACGGAQTDTITVNVDVEPPPNTRPVFTPDAVSAVITEGGAPYSVEFTATDADSDILTLIPPSASELDMAKYGFSYQILTNIEGRVSARLQWDTRCDVYDFSEKRDFKFKFVVNDIDKCDLTPNDTLHFDLKRNIPDFHDPVIEYVPDRSLEKVVITKKIYETVNFDVEAFDVDPDDVLTLYPAEDNFTLAEQNIVFPTVTFRNSRTENFNWYLDCDKINIQQQDEFHFYLIVKSKENFCGYDLADTLDVVVNVEPPVNNAPEIQISGNPSDTEMSIVMGESVTLPLTGIDADVAPKDNLTLSLAKVIGNVPANGYEFTADPVSTSPVNGTFKWKPGCDVFSAVTNGDFKNTFIFKFLLADDRCFTAKDDSITFTLNIRDVENDPAEFIPPNVITPGDDNGLNEYFAMEKMVDGELVSILPKDNCRGRFVNIVIMNRWGRKVYESNSRDFRWFAEGEPSGVYYYLLKYSDREYKGTVSVLGGSESRNR